jgi:hypothetical protein
MEALELSRALADPIQVLGMSFYFDPQTRARGKELGLNVFEFYGLGRGGALGDVDTQTVFDAFTFFHPDTIDFLWTNAKAKADPVEVAAAHVRAAYEFADRTFGGIDLTTHQQFAVAARRVVDAEPSGVCPLVDGYKLVPAPADPVHASYLGTIFLRELRGGLHIRAVNEVELDPLVACYLQDPALFTLHGYPEESAPTVTAELEAKKRRAEELTDAAEAKCFDVLSDAQRDALLDGATQMFAALESPVPVAR